MSIHISKIKISNIMGVENLEFEPGKVNIVKGKNGLGKTSVIKALSSALGGGNQVEIIRVGSDKGEVCIEFTDNSLINKTIGKNGSSLVVKDSEGSKVGKPQNYINAILDAYSFNPISIITASKKDRISLILEALPMKATKEDFRAVFNVWVDHEKFPVEKLEYHPLKAIEEFHKSIYESRTEANIELKKTYAIIDGLTEASINIDAEDVTAEIEALTKQMQEAIAEVDVKIDDIYKIRDKDIEDLQATYNISYKRIMNELKELENWNSERKQAIANDYNQKHSELLTQRMLVQKPILVEIAKLQEQEKQQIAAKQQKEIIANLAVDVEKLSKKADTYTTYLKGLEKMKSDFLSKIPIPGLSVQEGEIYYNDVPFDLVNTQGQIDIACRIAELRSRELGFIFVDGFERLDKEHQEAFIERFSKSELQLLVTEVSNDESLNIEVL